MLCLLDRSTSVLLCISDIFYLRADVIPVYHLELVFVAFSTESRENPFTANGELSQKADYILSHSTITRTELDIKDPDALGSGDQVNETCTVAKVSATASAPNSGPTDGKPIEVEVAKGSAVPPQPQHAEEVKLKKRKCCTVL